MKSIRVVAAIIKDKDKILATKRSYGEFKGGWEFPGGKIEEGEDKKTALIREIKEEVGVNFKIDRYLGIVENFFINANQEKTHGIDFYYLGTTEDEIPLENFDLIENDNGIIINHHFKWMELQKLTDYDIRPKCIIPYLRNEQNTSFHLVQRETD